MLYLQKLNYSSIFQFSENTGIWETKHTLRGTNIAQVSIAGISKFHHYSWQLENDNF